MGLFIVHNSPMSSKTGVNGLFGEEVGEGQGSTASEHESIKKKSNHRMYQVTQIGSMLVFQMKHNPKERADWRKS